MEYAQTMAAIETSSNRELDKLIKLCIGKVLSMGSRPERDGDIEQYNRCSYLAKLATDELARRGWYDEINRRVLK